VWGDWCGSGRSSRKRSKRRDIHGGEGTTVVGIVVGMVVVGGVLGLNFADLFVL